MKLFDFVKAVTETKEDLSKNEDFVKDYIPVLVNKALSFNLDTIIEATNMNLNCGLSKKMQFTYYLNSIRRKKRYSKWIKPIRDENIALISKYYGINGEKAKSVLDIFSGEQLNEIKNRIGSGNDEHISPCRRIHKI